MPNNETLACLNWAGSRLAVKGMMLAASILSNDVNDHRNYLTSKLNDDDIDMGGASTATNLCKDLDMHEKNQNRIALFGVSDLAYVPKYWTTFASIGCSPPHDQVDYFLLIHDQTSTSSQNHGDDQSSSSSSSDDNGVVSINEKLRKETPSVLINKLSYISIDFSSSFTESTFHGAWPSVAYWWSAGPEMFGSAGYKYALYLDGDVVAAPPYMLPYCNRITSERERSSGVELGGFKCSAIHSELVPLLQGMCACLI
jgi:hypothetical protein